MTGAGRLTPSVAGRRTACGRHGAAFEAENGGVWAQGLLQPRAAARGRVPCVFVRLSAVDGVARSAGRRASCEPLGLAGCFGGQVQRPKCIPWRQVGTRAGSGMRMRSTVSELISCEARLYGNPLCKCRKKGAKKAPPYGSLGPPRGSLLRTASHPTVFPTRLPEEVPCHTSYAQPNGHIGHRKE